MLNIGQFVVVWHILCTVSSVAVAQCISTLGKEGTMTSFAPGRTNPEWALMADGTLPTWLDLLYETDREECVRELRQTLGPATK